MDEVIETLEDWGEDLAELKKSTTPFDGFLPVEGEEVFALDKSNGPSPWKEFWGGLASDSTSPIQDFPLILDIH